MEKDEARNGFVEDEWQILPVEQVEGRNSWEAPGGREKLWALVLEARSIPCRLEQGEQGGERLLVPPHLFNLACSEIAQFEKENRDWPPLAPPPRSLRENTLATVSILLLLAVFHNLVQLGISLPGIYPPDWAGLGKTNSNAILDGQWWRLATALTLHADWVHLSSNLAIGGIFIIFLCRELGSGLAWFLLLASGMLGNLINALVQSPSHTSVGASTAVFGAVGILGAISLLRYRHQLQRRWPVPVAAALALLAVLGTGTGTEGHIIDLGAHLFGFAAGMVLGLVTEFVIARKGPPGRMMNAMLAVTSMAVVVVAWWLALKAG